MLGFTGAYNQLSVQPPHNFNVLEEPFIQGHLTGELNRLLLHGCQVARTLCENCPLNNLHCVLQPRIVQLRPRLALELPTTCHVAGENYQRIVGQQSVVTLLPSTANISRRC